ncbi:MAG: RagB/SusD family nutrient uptake outer membrane protein [Candidatus Azobacteroides sp.]|nr:RagB/SusD family nutrient uptake outer membrane protein [Candidatus Azobacteroides sp.]
MLIRSTLLLFTLMNVVFLSGCLYVLDEGPIDSNVTTTADVFNNPESYKLSLVKLYAGLAVTGQMGAVGQPDISGIDEGFSAYLRQYWCAQELTTDEAIIGSVSGNIREYHAHNWSASNEMVTALYSRIFYQISICNEYIRQVAPRISSLDSELQPEVIHYLAEARFLRALSYWHALDFFGDVPLVTEKDPVGKYFPKQPGKKVVFEYIESELKAIEDDLVDARNNEYARADKGCAWALLVKLYLNAEIYIDEKKYSECIDYCKKIINSGYKLHPNYPYLFLADNHFNNPEIIFPVAFDGKYTKTYGGTNFIIFSATGGRMDPEKMGIVSGWGITRTTKALVNKFPDSSGETDIRAMFFKDGQNIEIENLTKFQDGYAIHKFKNVDSGGIASPNKDFVDTDYPVFRLADIYLSYAEAVLREGRNGELEEARKHVNQIRERAYGNTHGCISLPDLTLFFILDERARELYWEGHRRTDLIRYGMFTGSAYIWPWKGNQPAGTSTEVKYNLFPIPSSEIGANPELVQHIGY